MQDDAAIPTTAGPLLAGCEGEICLCELQEQDNLLQAGITGVVTCVRTRQAPPGMADVFQHWGGELAAAFRTWSSGQVSSDDFEEDKLERLQ